MWFRLARMLGMSVARAKEEIDSEEFYWWKVYLSIEPFDRVEENMRHAILCTNLNRIAAGRCISSPRYEHFVVDYTKEVKPEAEVKSMLNVVRAFVASYNKSLGG